MTKVERKKAAHDKPAVSEKRVSVSWVLPLFIVGFLSILAAALAFGAAGLRPKELLCGIFRPETGAGRIFWYVRLPRVLATTLCGAALGMAGAIIQGVLHNPLAGPNIIGVNAGAGFGAVLCMAVYPAAGALGIGMFAFCGAFLATILILLLSRRSGGAPLTLVLAGVALASLFTAGIDAMTTLVPDALPASSQFKIGGAAGVGMTALIPLVIVTLPTALLSICFHRELDILSLGEDMAHGLGLSPRTWRVLFLLLACALASAAVAVMGLIGFIGLLVPHAVRLCGAKESGKLLPLSAIGGAGFLTLCDLLARTLFAPFELPVGILLSALGAPFFLYLLLGRRKA